MSDIARRRKERRQAHGRRSDTRWQEILAGAARVFARIGYHPATLEDIAAEVGLNRATLYYYVGTKEELLAPLLRGPLETLRQQLEAAAARPLPAREKLATSLREYVAAMTEHPELFIFLGENIHNVMSGPEADAITANADQYGRVLAQVIAAGAQAGEFRSDIDPMVAVLAVLGMFNWMHRWYNPAGEKSLAEFGEDFITLALSSLTP